MNRLTDPYVTPALDEILEAILLAAGEPVSLERLETVFEADQANAGLFDSRQPPSRAAIRESLNKLGERLASGGALELIESASGYQVRIRQRYSPWVSRLWDEKPQRYSRALLETLALIAYRQPVTRGDIEEVRGVAVSSSIMRTLVERGWIRVVGHRDVPGRPAVYATTRTFLDDLGLKTLDSLPPMHELKQFETFETFETGMHEPFEDVPPVETADEDGGETSSPEEGGSKAAVETQEPDLSAASGECDNDEPDNDEHAEMASPGESLSFAELEARLAERARKRQAEAANNAGPADENSDTDT
ncbi:MAG: SMC-Scp complex subunit ScpB [Pseudomonadota bacterium]|uniref:SMC-Scp complex subunit ScpB n=1 Tax=Salinicola salarius TaxID=430457 RepID=UPI0023E441AC|nr:SMC-Scp complex subunit ScpB [Salinicola salarius]MDF3919639.1 SMC-Scp complex subunit ScpB [Salinicola salarius]MEC8917938.1 SMC-Scp complex subunit ScpB [Pseudomonadota bacterium]MED5499993.1 SMC-Scp complex subunit ScpB [Pseudomonadota bacterium]